MSLKDKIIITPRRLIRDERGWFLKAITGTEDYIPMHTGEIYLTMGKFGEIKGGHYHPEALEWFTLVQGNAILRLEDIETKERMEIPMTLEDAKTVFVPNKIAHDFKNSGTSDFIVLAYTDKLYDPKDTVAYKL